MWTEVDGVDERKRTFIIHSPPLFADPPFPTLRRVEKKEKELREAAARPLTEDDVNYVSFGL